MKLALTPKMLEDLAMEARKDRSVSRLVYCGLRPGFYVRQRAGRLSFGFSYRHKGKERRMSLGVYGPVTLDQALVRYRAAYNHSQDGKDPLEDRENARVRRATFADAVELYLLDLAERAETGVKRGRRSTAAEFRGMLHRHALEVLGGLPVEDVGLEEVEALHRSMWKTPATGNRLLSALSAVLNYAERRRLRPVGSNPCRLVLRYKESPKRERFTLEELRALGEALRAAEAESRVSQGAALAVRLLALHGWRRSEVLAHALRARRPQGGGGLRWEDVDLPGRVVFLRDAKAGDRVAPLSAPAVSLLADLRPVSAAGPVCTGRRPGSPLTNLERPWQALLEAAELPHRGLHALRRSVASLAADRGFGPYVVGGLLGHAAAGVTGQYVVPGDPVRQAAEQVASEIAEALGMVTPPLARLLSMTAR